MQGVARKPHLGRTPDLDVREQDHSLNHCYFDAIAMPGGIVEVIISLDETPKPRDFAQG